MGRLKRDIARKLTDNPALKQTVQLAFDALEGQCDQITAQVKDHKYKPKLYSLHEPHVQVFSKAKAHKRYEFGNKVSLATPTKRSAAGQFIIGCQSFEGAPYDGHTLKGQIEQVERLTNTRLKRVVVDKGYKGHKGHGKKGDDVEVFLSGAKRGVTPQIARELKRRQAIEPVIGHVKQDHRMERCYYRGTQGDNLNALFAAIGYNFRLLARWLRLLLCLIVAGLVIQKDKECSV